MREDVEIVLNERESRKSALAQELVARFSSKNITASRLPPDEQLLEVLLERSPRLVVTDYLLEGFGTGIDLLLGITQRASPPIQVIFLTDEPSLSVAVEAMRLGASDYVELDAPGALDSVISRTEALLTQAALEPSQSSAKRPLGLDDLVFSSAKGLRLLDALKGLALRQPPLVVLYGNLGCGRRTIARSLANAAPETMAVREWDLLVAKEAISEILSPQVLQAPLRRIVVNAEEEAAAILRILSDSRHSPINKKMRGSLFLCTSEEGAVRLFKQLPEVEILRIPSLTERNEEIPVLTQLTLQHAAKILGRKPPELTSEALNWLQSAGFPGELRQLEAVVLNAAIRSFLNDAPLISCLQECHAQWEREWHTPARSENISPLLAAQVYQQSAHDPRIAALRLGIRTSALRTLLETP